MEAHEQRLERARALVKRAIAADEASAWRDALGLYSQALGEFHTLLVAPSAAEIAPGLQAPVASYLARALELRALLQEQPRLAPPPGKAVPVKAAAAAAEGGGDEEDEALYALMATKRGASRVAWDDVIGHAETKRLLQTSVLTSLRRPELFGGNLRPLRALLLYGPPGTGKTHLALALASACASEGREHAFFNLSAADLISKWQGESGRRVQAIFRVLRRHRPAILFLDEVDALCGARGDDGGDSSHARVVTQFLHELNALDTDETLAGTLLVGATNRPWALDAAMLRRFGARCHVALPDAETRAALLRHYAARDAHTLAPDDFDALARATAHFSADEIARLVEAAARLTLDALLEARHFVCLEEPDDELRLCYVPCDAHTPGAQARRLDDIRGAHECAMRPPLTRAHLERALACVRPLYDAQSDARYAEWTTRYGAGA